MVEAKAEMTGRVFRSFTSTGAINGSLQVTSIRKIVAKYSKIAQCDCAPHDLRRSFAKLSRLGGAPLETIQHTLGHASIRTTEVYLNTGEEANAGDYFAL